jgi:hypothetical protein
LFFVLTAWAWPSRGAHWVHFVFVPLMVLHWLTNEDRCVLSELEQKYKKKPADQNLPGDVEEGQFVRSILKKFLGRNPTAKQLQMVIYVIVIFVWSLTALRLFVLS